jgi:hypothetical protein
MQRFLPRVFFNMTGTIQMTINIVSAEGIQGTVVRTYKDNNGGET